MQQPEILWRKSFAWIVKSNLVQGGEKKEETPKRKQNIRRRLLLKANVKSAHSGCYCGKTSTPPVCVVTVVSLWDSVELCCRKNVLSNGPSLTSPSTFPFAPTNKLNVAKISFFHQTWGFWMLLCVWWWQQRQEKKGLFLRVKSVSYEWNVSDLARDSCLFWHDKTRLCVCVRVRVSLSLTPIQAANPTCPAFQRGGHLLGTRTHLSWFMCWTEPSLSAQTLFGLVNSTQAKGRVKQRFYFHHHWLVM